MADFSSPLSIAAHCRLLAVGGPVLAFLVGLIGTALAIDFVPLSMTRLIGLTDLAVLGRVVAVGEESVRIEVEEDLIGKSPTDELEIIPYRPWPKGSKRPVPYEVGQRFLLFLRHENGSERDPPWRIVGVGGEGEMPVEGERTYLRGLSVDFLDRRQYRIYGADAMDQRFSTATLMDAVGDFRKCFSMSTTGDRPRLTRTCDDATLDMYRARSRMHEYLAAAALSGEW